MGKLIYSKNSEKMAWGPDFYKAVTGLFGKRALPSGAYLIKVRNVVVSPNGKGFMDNLTSKSWFIPIEPVFTTKRNGLGIHPDGGRKGTLGCIGFQGADSDRFWKKWLQTALDQRPTSLIVKD